MNKSKNQNQLVNEGDYLVICNGFLKCDDPNNKKGFTFNGKIFSSSWINVYEKCVYNDIPCFRVRIHHHMGCDYEGADKIVPEIEFNKQGIRPEEYSKEISWYAWKKPSRYVIEFKIGQLFKTEYPKVVFQRIDNVDICDVAENKEEFDNVMKKLLKPEEWELKLYEENHFIKHIGNASEFLL
jgi:hypothetical protein